MQHERGRPRIQPPYHTIQRALAACIADGAGPVEATVRLKVQKCHYDLIGDIQDLDELGKHEMYIMRAEQSFMQTKTRLRRLADVQPVPAAPPAPVCEAHAQIDLMPERCRIEPFLWRICQMARIPRHVPVSGSRATDLQRAEVANAQERSKMQRSRSPG